MEERLCPNCGSGNVEPDTRRTNVLGELMFNPDKWFCNECDYTGLMPEGRADKEFEFEPEDQSTVDTDAGKGYLKAEIVLFSTAIIFTVLFLLLR
jgi:ribosomal protein S27AE